MHFPRLAGMNPMRSECARCGCAPAWTIFTVADQRGVKCRECGEPLVWETFRTFRHLYAAADRVVPRELREYGRFLHGRFCHAWGSRMETMGVVNALVCGMWPLASWPANRKPNNEPELALLDKVARFLEPQAVATLAAWRARIVPALEVVRASVCEDRARAARDATKVEFVRAMNALLDEADDLVLPLYHIRWYGMDPTSWRRGAKSRSGGRWWRTTSIFASSSARSTRTARSRCSVSTTPTSWARMGRSRPCATSSGASFGASSRSSGRTA